MRSVAKVRPQEGLSEKGRFTHPDQIALQAVFEEGRSPVKKQHVF